MSLVVYDGHFWINIENELDPARKAILKQDAGNTDALILVKGELWARIDNPHPSKRQKLEYKAGWRPEEIELSSSLKKMPDIREKK